MAAPTSPAAIAWQPDPARAASTRLARLMRRHGIPDYPALHRRSVEDPEWFWAAVSEDLGFRWQRPYAKVMDASGGLPFTRWWSGGRLNYVETCLDRHLPRLAGKVAIRHEGEEGTVRTLTYAETLREVSRLAGALRRLGVGKGDRVGVFMPFTAECAVATLAISRIGAIYVPIFSGYAAPALASRLRDAEAVALVTADGFHRRGHVVAMKEVADEALREAPSVRHVVVQRRLGRDVPWTPGRDLRWEEVVAEERELLEAEEMDPEDPFLVIYTSGTTGRPKGTVHVHGGFPFKAAMDMAYAFDLGEEDTLFWLTDLGWMMGPWEIGGALALGGTMVLYDGAIDHPQPDRLWALLARHQVTICGVSPTAIRALMPHGEEMVARHDLSALRLLGSTGEAWNPEPWHWYLRNVGGGRCPIVNYSGGTEVAGGILWCTPLEPLKPCCFTGPTLGMDADVYDEAGRPVRGAVGELVVKNAWPGMTRGFWRDPERYLQTYWSRWPGVWVHGDWVTVDADGFWFTQGRSDDTLKVAGKRLGPAEVESALVAHPAVSEAAAIGVPDELKGEAVVCFAVLRPGTAPSSALGEELADLVARELGKPLRPKRVLFVRDLPKTRNAKIVRRAIRARYLGLDPGDLSSLEDPRAVEGIPRAG